MKLRYALVSVQKKHDTGDKDEFMCVLRLCCFPPYVPYLLEQVHVEVSGEKTQTVFNNVFDKMVAAAQPIPGFRRVKGGMTSQNTV